MTLHAEFFHRGRKTWIETPLSSGLKLRVGNQLVARKRMLSSSDHSEPVLAESFDFGDGPRPITVHSRAPFRTWEVTLAVHIDSELVWATNENDLPMALAE